MSLHNDDSKKLRIFLNLFSTRVNLLDINTRNEIINQKRYIYFLLLKKKGEKAHICICSLLRNENIHKVLKILLSLCKDSNLFLFFKNEKNKNDNETKRCIRNILYCSNKLMIKNRAYVRNNFIHIFGKKYIDLIETNYHLIDDNINQLLNKYTFSSTEIGQAQNNIIIQMNKKRENINNNMMTMIDAENIKTCICNFCKYSQTEKYNDFYNNENIYYSNHNPSLNLNKSHIEQIVDLYKNKSEKVYDEEQNKILQKMEKQIISTLNKKLLNKSLDV
ncbi:conserved Plasmodium protein, unknown function [Plasmodium sp. gorilla clade G3]|nr:conserved Plasmodium protein, unknown function [Plasmodium sp. gorilla clade G3]